MLASWALGHTTYSVCTNPPRGGSCCPTQPLHRDFTQNEQVNKKLGGNENSKCDRSTHFWAQKGQEGDFFC